MKEIGGYLGLELSTKEEYHTCAIKLNSGRNAFRYILEAQNIKKIYILGSIAKVSVLLRDHAPR